MTKGGFNLVRFTVVLGLMLAPSAPLAAMAMPMATRPEATAISSPLHAHSATSAPLVVQDSAATSRLSLVLERTRPRGDEPLSEKESSESTGHNRAEVGSSGSVSHQVSHESIAGDVWADAVVSAVILGEGNRATDPTQALGPPDYNGSSMTGFVSLGGGELVLDMGEGEQILDTVGNDLRVCNPGTGSREAYDVYVSNSSTDSWQLVGSASGNGKRDFDLGVVGIPQARYVRVVDLSTGIGGSYPGVDIDYVAALHSSHDPYADEVVYSEIAGDRNQHTDPTKALGLPDYEGGSSDTYVSLGGGGELVLDMGEGEEIAYGSGPDLRVCNPGGNGGEISEVYVGETPTGPWAFVGRCFGSPQINDFDIELTALSQARYVRLLDVSTGDLTDTNPATDVDYVEALHMVSEGPTFSISGHVRDGSGDPIADVTISTDTGAPTTTDVSGAYTITNLASGTYVLHPSKVAYAFTPDAITIEIDSDRVGANFRGHAIACAIPLAEPFLRFPLAEYRTFESFESATNDTWDGGQLSSWFDHDTPRYEHNPNRRMTLYTGETYTGTVWRNGLPCMGKYCYDGHDGYDIVRPAGGPANPDIHAAGEGTVVACCSNGEDGCEADCWPLGHQVWVNHGNNYATVYAHLEAVSVTVGTEVTADTPVGTMGQTGRSTGDHLHFGVYLNWNLRDPWITSITSARSDEVVDPFGWDGLEQTPPVSDTWDTPSVNLWQHASRIASPIEASGGQLASPSGRVVIRIPPGALDYLTLLALREGPVSAASAALRSAGSGFWLRALWDWITDESSLETQSEGANLAESITVTVSYTDTALSHLDATQLAIQHWDEAADLWQPLDTALDAAAQTATAQTDELGAFDLQAPLVCPEDVLEPNDRYATASLLTAGEPIRTLFDIPDDEDWFRLEAVGGVTYTLETSELAAGVDTIMGIYDTDASTLLSQDDDGGEGLSSRLVFAAPASRSFYVLVRGAGTGVTGCDARYTLGAAAEAPDLSHQVYLPLVLRSQ